MRSATGEFSLRGDADDYTVSLRSDLAAPGYADGDLRLNGRGGREAFELEEMKLDALGGSLLGNGRVRFAPDLQATLALEGKGLNPGVLAPAYPGDLQLSLQAAGGMADGGVTATVETLTVDGRFRDRPVDLGLTGSLRDGQFDLDKLSVRSGQTRISASGRIDDQVDLAWTIDSPDLGDLLPGAAGSLAGEGSASGPVTLPALRADIEGDALAFAGYRLARLDLTMDVDLQRAAPSSLGLTVDRLSLPGAVEINSVTLDGSGNRQDHRLTLRVDASEAAASLALAGALYEAHWQGELVSGGLKYSELAPWQLVDSQPLRLGAEDARLERGCWASGEARLCLQGGWAARDLEADFSLSAFDLAYLRPLLPPSIALEGMIEATGRASQPLEAEPIVSLAIDGTGVELRTGPAVEPPDERVLSLAPSSIHLDYQADGLLATLSLPFLAGGGLSGEARVEAGDAPLAEQPLRGSLALDLEDLAVLQEFSPEIEAARGSLRGALALAGTLASPRATGEIRLADGSLGLLTPGLTVSDIGLRAVSADGETVTFEGSAASGGGTLRIEGAAELDIGQPSVTLAVLGDSFEVANTADVRVRISPDLQIASGSTGVKVNGEVRVPWAQITPQELPRSVVTASDDEVIITDDPAGKADGAVQQAVDARVRVVFGEAVTVDGFGFKGRLDGAVTVTQRPGQPVLGSGEINILDGEYRAYGQGLVIDQGQIVFADGPISQPGINVRALRRPAEGIVVGVQVRGPLQQPDFKVFSDPAMTQSEQLSWLVLGRSLNGASEGEGNMIAQAAIALGLKGGNVLADRFGGELGVDTVGIETGSGEAGAASDVNEAALVVGKYLSPGLYVSYGIGLFDAISTVRLEYSLDENWKVSTESSTLGSGGDVTYTIER